MSDDSRPTRLLRIAEHVRTQNWTAIAIDFAIVVIGVFVGIQVANWNEARGDARRAVGYLERIGADLEADIAGYRNRMARWQEYAEQGALALAFADTGDVGDATPWQVLLAFYQASTLAAPSLNTATYDELRSAGELRLIADAGLRAGLSAYYAAGVPTVTLERPAYRIEVRKRIPLPVQRHILAQCFAPDALFLRAIPCPSPIGDEEARAIAVALAADRELIGELRYRMSSLESARVMSEMRVEAATELRTAVAAAKQRGAAP